MLCRIDQSKVNEVKHRLHRWIQINIRLQPMWIQMSLSDNNMSDLQQTNTLSCCFLLQSQLTETTVRRWTCSSNQTYYIGSEPKIICSLMLRPQLRSNNYILYTNFIVFALTRPRLKILLNTLEENSLATTLPNKCGFKIQI